VTQRPNDLTALTYRAESLLALHRVEVAVQAVYQILRSDENEIEVRRIVIDNETTESQVFIGGVGAGVYLQFPEFILAGYDFAVDDGTTITSSSGGQTSRNKGASLRSRAFVWPALTKVQFDALNGPVLAHGIGKSAFWDLFEENREFDPPMWATVTKAREVNQVNENQFNFKLSLQEAQ
jgi:hypothetical protein